MSLTVVAAVTANGVIGRDNGMPWHLPEDLKRFRALTMGRPMVMGRRTFDSIGRPLPGRRTVVVTRDASWHHDGVEVVRSPAAALELLAGLDVVLAGGGELYRQLWDDVDVLEITHIDREIDGDTRLPPIDPDRWVETARDDRDGFSFVSYRRR
ncbi:dihydrofolate reductase [Nakamurella deserti]|uniref:dihydrofolate reductase n=1 Tax=Nakamurella deserti TaxID=2164074 RepID=UPI000DBE7902|nr:dihydrofolate reductase [Nakamurella deserti]